MKIFLLFVSLCCLALFSSAQTVSLATYASDGSITQSNVTVPFCTTQIFIATVSLPSGATETTPCGNLEWNVNGLVYETPIISGSLSQSFSVPITTAANYNVSATINVGPAGCSYSTPFTSNTITVTGEVEDIHIDGPLQVCAAPQTFTVRNLPAGTPISWTVPSTIQIISGQNTPTIEVEQIGTGSSTGNISATIGGTVCGYAPGTLNLSISIGVAAPTSIAGFAPFQNFAPNYDYSFSANNGNDWIVSGGTLLSGQGTHAIVVQTPNVTSGFLPFTIEVREDNACGVSAYYSVDGKIQAGTSGPHVVMGPNPAAGTVTLSVASDATQEQISKITSLPAGIRQIKIFDVTGRLRKAIENEAAASSLQLDVSDLTNGIYFVETVVGNTIDRQKLIVQH